MAKVFDCFTFFNELDILEARLVELADIVDYFVIVECRQTFQGAPKPLYFEENRERFREFAPKIIHIVTDFPAVVPFRKFKDKRPAWQREFYQRNQILRGLGNAAADDLIIVSDVDEIIRADALTAAIQERRRHDLTIFEMAMHTFYVNRTSKSASRKATDLRWLGPRMVERSRLSTPQDLRETKLFVSRSLRGTLLGELQTRAENYLERGIGGRPVVVRDSGWHFTSIGSWENWRAKVASYCHKEEYSITDAFQSEEAFSKNIRAGTDEYPLFSLPRFMIENPERFPLCV